MRPNRIPPPSSCSGFTMLELIAVILIIGILSFMAAGRLNDTGEVNAHGFAEQVASTLRFAQEAAVAQRRWMYVNVNAASGLVNACLDASNACAQPLTAPGGGSLAVQAPGGAALTTNTAQFYFDGLGQPYAPSQAAISSQIQIHATAPDGQQFNVTVEPVSGYVRRS